MRGALYDPNTGLDTCPAVMEAVRAFFHKTRSVGLIHLEVDPQSRVEMVYGWQVLDRLLNAVSTSLQELRGDVVPEGAVICQTGICADRFVIFLPLSRGEQRMSPSPLDEICRRIAVRLGHRFGGADFRAMAPRPAFSIGAATVMEHPFFRLERQIYDGIDEARISASKGELQERTRRHAELKRIIREEEIHTLFQPIVDLSDERIIGYEAFSRGPVDSIFEMPNVLFECGKEVGMTGALDLLCQRAALNQARRLSAGDKLFINALPASLLDPGFREGLLADLPLDFPIRREDIVLDIADRNSVSDYEAFESEVTDLRAKGFCVSIDDVGKSTASLEHLVEVSPDFIKVDDSIIRGIHTNLVKQEMLRSLSHVAAQIKAVVIAEGIETREELEAARRCGATLGQGFLFYRPSGDLPARGLKTEKGKM
jgi:EAL domain-containing protein (putative c-di-GMP-specific phosphodiesterase class I)